MTLGIRKLVVLGLVGAVLLLANMAVVLQWLQERGVIELAARIRDKFLTGTTIAVVIVLLILLVHPRSSRTR